MVNSRRRYIYTFQHHLCLPACLALPACAIPSAFFSYRYAPDVRTAFFSFYCAHLTDENDDLAQNEVDGNKIVTALVDAISLSLTLGHPSDNEAAMENRIVRGDFMGCQFIIFPVRENYSE